MVNTEMLEMDRKKTSINIDQELWREIRKTAIDLNMSATDFVEESCHEKLTKVRKEKSSKK